MVINMPCGLLRLLGREMNTDAPRSPDLLRYSANVWTTADFPTPAGPVIHKSSFSNTRPSNQAVMRAINLRRVSGWQRGGGVRAEESCAAPRIMCRESKSITARRRHKFKQQEENPTSLTLCHRPLHIYHRSVVHMYGRHNGIIENKTFCIIEEASRSCVVLRTYGLTVFSFHHRLPWKALTSLHRRKESPQPFH